MRLDFQDNTGDAAWRRALRQEMLARRQTVDGDTHTAWCARIVAHLQAELPGQTGQIIAFCWPIKQEPDVRAALPAWLTAGCTTALPVVMAAQSPLAFHVWKPGDALNEDRYGIPTPAAGRPVHPDILIIPLNGFDPAGYRLGYGGGYFDRTLAALQPKPRTIGVGFEINRVDSIRPQPYDQRLDLILTEAGVVFRA